MPLRVPGSGLRPPKPDTEFRLHHGRLALFHPAEEQGAFWSEYWTTADADLYRAQGEQGGLAAIDRYWPKIPVDRPVVDAGAGLGHATFMLHRLGFRTVGLDYRADVVEAARRIFPEPTWATQDVEALGLRDGSIGAYVSLGIVEHFEEGPDVAYREARRVLCDDGIAIFELPHLNPRRAAALRRLRSAAPRPDRGDGLSFHQYYFSPRDVHEGLAAAGFEVLDHRHDSTEGFLQREVPWLSQLWRSSPTRVRSAIRPFTSPKSRVLGDRWAHMMIYLARPTGRR